MRFSPQPESGRWPALAFTVLVHGVLLVFLFLGVQWKRNPPATESMAVELWSSRPGPQAAEISPPPRPVPEIKPPPEPELSPPPEPEVVVKPAIPIQAKKPKVVVPERLPPPPKKEAAKAVVDPPPPRLDFNRLMQSDSNARAIQKEIDGVKAQSAASAASQRALASWRERIAGKIRGNTVQPPSLRGNPVAIFVVGLLPSGEIVSVRLKRSSGLTAWDEATERAIWKSSPLPKPEDPASSSRELDLSLCPDEQQGCS